MNDVPLAAPRDERPDIDGADFSIDLVTQPRPEYPKVSNLVPFVARLHPLCARLRHIERKQVGGTCPFAQESMDRMNVALVGHDEAMLPVGRGIGDILDLFVRSKRKKEGHAVIGIVSDNRLPQGNRACLEGLGRRIRKFVRLRQAGGIGTCRRRCRS